MSDRNIGGVYLESVVFRLRTLKELGTRTIELLSAGQLGWQANSETNSVAVIVQHLNGNMLSRWTDFLTTDGDKPTRNRDAEFVEPGTANKEAVLSAWEEGWRCVLGAVEALEPSDLARDIFIRKQPLSVIDAINRQVVHYGYHTGQIVQIAKSCLGDAWTPLSIPRGKSKGYQPTKRD